MRHAAMPLRRETGLYEFSASRHNVASFRPAKAVRPSEAGMNAASSLVATALSRMTRSAASKERSIVKTSLISASLVAILAAGAAASLAFGQGGGAGPNGQNIAV